jgi:hypothetical protein
MQEQDRILCVSNAYTRQFYIGEKFRQLPEAIKEELQIMCVLYTEDVGGILILRFEEDGELEFETTQHSDDFNYDEIGSVLKIKQLRNEKRELFESLEMYYKVLYLGAAWEE